MPSLALKVYSVFFKLLLKHKLQTLLQQSAAGGTEASFGVASRPDESAAPSNPSFGPDGVATKDIHVDLLSSLSLRLFLPDSSLAPRNGHAPHHQENGAAYGGYLPPVAPPDARRRSHAGSPRKLPVILQFHGGAFVGGSNTSTANDFFCRRIAKLLDVIVIAVGYRLAPENRYPAAFEDGFKVLNWLGKQANLAECSKSMESTKAGGVGDASRSQIVDSLGASSQGFPYRAVRPCTARYVSFRQLTGTWIGRYRAVLPKGDRRRSIEEKSRREEEEEEEEEMKKEEAKEKRYLEPSSPARRYHLRVARGRFFSPRGEKRSR
ncbi:hypothetical protein BHE74_00040935, partial [Ensete ventricosum]